MSEHMQDLAFHAGFTMDDQDGFAALSGDWNPIHIDPVAARRLLFGEVVVHGIHQVLWALDRFCALRGGLPQLAELNAIFKQPVTLGKRVVMEVDEDEDRLDLSLRVGGVLTTEVTLTLAKTGSAPWSGIDWRDKGWVQDTPDEAGFGVLETARGAVPLQVDAAAFAARFPALAADGQHGMAVALMASTRVVGMKAPGLHSLYSELAVVFGEADAPAGALNYAVTRANPELRILDVEITATSLRGELRTFMRPAPIRQLDMAAAAAVVSGCDLSDRRVLVIGGSRGLGEVAVKLLASAGADVTLTYASGRTDADRLVQTVIAAGGRARAERFDILEPNGLLPEGHFTHVCFFAAPRIRPGAAGGFDEELFNHYMAWFATAFGAVARRVPGPATVLYPSTVYIAEPEKRFAEYAAAKAAAETLATYLSADRPDITMSVMRLPRMRTDQTQALFGADAPEPAEILWPWLLAEGINA